MLINYNCYFVDIDNNNNKLLCPSGKIINAPTSKMPGVGQMNYSRNSNYHTPASALYEGKEVVRSSTNSSVGRSHISGMSSCPHHHFCPLLPFFNFIFVFLAGIFLYHYGS